MPLRIILKPPSVLAVFVALHTVRLAELKLERQERDADRRQQTCWPEIAPDDSRAENILVLDL